MDNHPQTSASGESPPKPSFTLRELRSPVVWGVGVGYTVLADSLLWLLRQTDFSLGVICLPPVLALALAAVFVNRNRGVYFGFLLSLLLLAIGFLALGCASMITEPIIH